MAKPQQPELHRSGLTPADPGSVKVHLQGDDDLSGKGATGPIPEDNLPGHHPEVEQDKPVDRFVARARELAEEAAANQEAPANQAAAEAPEGAGPESAGALTDAAPAAPVAARATRWLTPMAFVPVLAAIDASRQPDAKWVAIGESKWHWVRRISLLPPIGAWEYTTRVKPRLESAQLPGVSA